jgi:hypothetical protein
VRAGTAGRQLLDDLPVIADIGVRSTKEMSNRCSRGVFVDPVSPMPNRPQASEVTSHYVGEFLDDMRSTNLPRGVAKVDMNEYEVIPHVGVGPVRLGMPRAQVRLAMTRPPNSFKKGASAVHATDAFHDGAFQVFYRGPEPTVEFIELSSGLGVRALYQGVSVFETTADEVAARIMQEARFWAEDPELGYSYIFPDLELGLWRPSLPESPQAEEVRSFASVGIGIRGYYTDLIERHSLECKRS